MLGSINVYCYYYNCCHNYYHYFVVFLGKDIQVIYCDEFISVLAHIREQCFELASAQLLIFTIDGVLSGKYLENADISLTLLVPQVPVPLPSFS